MEWLDNITNCIISKLNGTPVECAINEEISIAKAECQLAELAVDIQKASTKITDDTVKTTYTEAVKRIRSKQQS